MAGDGDGKDGSALERRILGVLPTLTAKRRRLARLLLDEPYFVAFASAEEVGKRAEVDAATVVRFSRLLGYEGFTHLKRDIQATVPHFVTATEKLRQTLAAPARPDEVAFRVFEDDRRNIERTVEQTSPEDFRRAVDLLAGSRQTVVLAAGISTPVAWMLTHLLRLIGYGAVQPASGVETAAEIAGLDAEDVVVGISFWRYVRGTVEQFALARARGAAAISISDSRASPLAQLSDIAFVASTETLELAHSLVGPIALVNALVTSVALAAPDRTVARLASVDDVYRAAGITIE